MNFDLTQGTRAGQQSAACGLPDAFCSPDRAFWGHEGSQQVPDARRLIWSADKSGLPAAAPK